MGKVYQLSAKRVAGMKAPGRYGDGRGLLLKVTATGTKSWVFRYVIDGRERMMGLGPYPEITLEEARTLAYGHWMAVREGRDPIGERDAAKARRKAERNAAHGAHAITFADAAKAYFDAKHSEWKNPKHATQFLQSLEDYAYPHIGALSVAEITTQHILALLNASVVNQRTKARGPFWHVLTETASRVRMRVEKVLGWATVNGLRTGDNPAQWRGHLKEALPAPTAIKNVRHHPALPPARMADFMKALAQREGTAAAALRFTILTASRTGMTIGARWDEFDLAEGVWTVPADRMKGRKNKGKAHRVPLSAEALAILATLPREEGNPFVFVGDRKGKGVSDMAMAKVIERMQPADGKPLWVDAKGHEIVPHGFRSTFRDWAYDHTEFPRDVVEQCLAHVIGSKAELAYKRSDALARRRLIMEAWAAFVAGRAPAANVSPLRPVA